MMAKSKRGLGRGLGAILGEVGESYENSLHAGNDSLLVLELNIENIKPNPYQPRKNFDESALQELSDSIKEHGLLQPVVVCEDRYGEYILIAGERRLRASKLAGMESIRAILADIKFDKMRELALIENIQREELNPIELALSYQELLNEYNITHEELSQKIKKSRVQITNTLRLLNLEKFVQDYIMEGKLTQGHAKILITLSPDEQRIATDSIIGQKLTVRESEMLIRNIKTQNSIDEDRHPKMINKSHVDRELLHSVLTELLKQNFKANLRNNRLYVEFNQNVEIVDFLKKIQFKA